MERLTLDGEAGPLEAVLDLPPGPLRAAALLCHPHPPSGGTMHTHAVYRAMRALRDLGCAVLRFNFRGVGRSGGSLGAGAGECSDGRVAYAFLAERFPGLPLVAGGFSFGSWVGMTIGAEAHAQALLGLGVPYRSYDFEQMARSSAPKALVLADHDEFTSVVDLKHALGAMREPRRLWVVDGTSHLFTEALDRYQVAVHEAGDWLLREIGGARDLKNVD